MRTCSLALVVLVVTGCACMAGGCGFTTVVAGTGMALTEAVSILASPSTEGGGAVPAVDGGQVTLNDLDILTTGAGSVPLALRRGSAGISATDCRVISSGVESPCLYSTGNMLIHGGV